jgi:hypothetical protein
MGAYEDLAGSRGCDDEWSFAAGSPRGICFAAAAPGGAEGGGAQLETSGTAGGEGDPGGSDAGAPGGAGSEGDAQEGSDSSADRKRIAELEATIATQSEKLRKANALEEYGGITPEQAKQWQKANEERERKDAEARGEYQKLIAEAQQGVEAEKAKNAEVHTQYQTVLMERDLLSAAGGAGALDQAMSSLHDGGKPQIVAAVQDLFEYDPSISQTVHRFLQSKEDPTKRMGPAEFFTQERQGSLSIYFAFQGKPGGGGGGVGESDSAGGGETVKISRTDPAKVQKMEQADKGGRKVIWTD